MLGPASTVVALVSETEYFESLADGECPIYQIIPTATNAGAVTIETPDGLTTSWPAGSLVAGQKYDILIKRITFASGGFMGMKMARRPFGFYFGTTEVE